MANPSLVDPYAAGIVWDELVDSDSGEVNWNAPTSQRKWMVSGSNDINAVLATAPANIPGTNVRAGITHFFRGYKYATTSPTLGNTWLFTADYAFAVDTFELSFDTSGATAKREQALDQGTYYSCQSPGGPVTPGSVIPMASIPAFAIGTTYARGTVIAESGVSYSSKADANVGHTPPDATWWAVATLQIVPDFKGLIVDGVEVPDEKFDFTVTIRSKISTLPASYVSALADLTGHANDSPLTLTYKGQSLYFGTEELLYQGMPGKVTSEDGFEFTLKFSKQKSRGGALGTVVESPPGTTTHIVVLGGSVTLGVSPASVFTAPGGSAIITAQPPGTATYNVILGGSVTIGVDSVALFTPLIGSNIYIDGNKYTVTATDPTVGACTVTLTALGPSAGPFTITVGGYISPLVGPFILGSGAYINGNLYLVTAVFNSPTASTVTLTAMGPSAGPFTITVGDFVSLDLNPLIVGASGPIAKPGWRYLKVINKEVIIGGQKNAQPLYVIVFKVIRTASFSAFGIFT